MSGECLAVLTAVGRESYISKLTLEATKDTKPEESEMIRSLDRLVKAVGVIIIPVGSVLFFQEWHVLGGTFSSSIIAMVAAVLGMIPEGLYMTASAAMVVSTVRLAGRGVLVQNMKCIESLARIDVLCVDKTGTITESDIKVEGFSLARRDDDYEETELLIGDIVGALSSDNATMEALKSRFTKKTGREVLNICGFSSRYKYSGVTLESGSYVIGAPECVLGQGAGHYAEYIENMSERGYRVLALARTGDVPSGQPINDGQLIYSDRKSVV